MDVAGLELDKDKKYSLAHALAGVIRYDLIDRGLENGVLVFFKPTLTEGDPADIQNYRTLHPAFPHQSTANQWFDESQFESYRQLGRVSAESALEEVGTPDDMVAMTTSVIFNRLSQML